MYMYIDVYIMMLHIIFTYIFIISVYIYNNIAIFKKSHARDRPIKGLCFSPTKFGRPERRGSSRVLNLRRLENGWLPWSSLVLQPSRWWSHVCNHFYQFTQAIARWDFFFSGDTRIPSLKLTYPFKIDDWNINFPFGSQPIFRALPFREG